MCTLFALLWILPFLTNVLSHKTITTSQYLNLHDDPLFQTEGQESQLNLRSMPAPNKVTHLLTGNRQPRMQSPPNRLPMPQNGPINSGRPPMRGSQPQPTRPHPVFHAPPPRFGQNFPLEGNQIDLDLDDVPGTGTAIKETNDQWPVPTPETKIVHLDVKCEKNQMKVNIEFDKPFNGMIFSKGHYNYRHCVYLPANTGQKSVFFDISINACGTSGNAQGTYYNEDVTSDSGLFFENTVVIQYDPQVQEAWDQARKLRCTWHDQYEKAVSFRPFPVDMLDVVRADFAGDNVGCWMQIQVGKGPWASEVAGIVKIGQTMTMVLAIKDEENKFDMLVRNCIAHDGKRSPIELVDGNGCIMRPKLMTRFQKVKNFGSSASVLTYLHFQAFKFPDSVEVNFQCTIQICRHRCPEQCSQQSGELFNAVDSDGDKKKRRKRSEALVATPQVQDSKQVGLNKAIQVIAFPLEMDMDQNQSALVSKQSIPEPNAICVPKWGVMVPILLVCLACVFSTVFIIFRMNVGKVKNKVNKIENDAMHKLPNLYEMIRVN